MGLAFDFPGNKKIKHNIDCKAYKNMWDTKVSMRRIKRINN